MKISNQAIDHPRIVVIATILVIAMAIYSAQYIPVQRTPAITKAVVLVAIPYPDSQPIESENEVTRKIEKVLGELKNVDFISSSSMRGSSITQIMFLDGVDPEEARGEVKDLIDRIRNELPGGREIQPVVRSIDFENAPLMLVTISGPEDFDQRALKQIAEDVQDTLETVSGVANTQLFGGLEREIHVNVDPDLMTQYGISISDLRQALANFHAEVPGGSLNTSKIDASIRNETKFRGIEDIEQAILKQEDGRLLTISDVATVIDTNRRIKNLAQLNGRNCATIIVNKEADINTLGAAREVKKVVQDLQLEHPDLEFATTRDTSEEIGLMFRVLGSSAVFGALLVLVFLAWAMGLRISILVLLAIPFSSAIALIFLFAAGIPISNMVIFSFILVLGMVVDGAIIVAENIHRHIERGEDPVDAAKVGIEEVGIPVIAADLTTIAAFLPMLLVPGIMGDFMGVMPKVVSIALFGSVLVDHFFIPTIAARWYKKRELSAEHHQNAAAVLTNGGSNQSVEARIRPNIGFFTRIYAGILRTSLDYRFFFIPWCLLALGGAYFLFKSLPFEFFPESDRGQFEIKYELPLGYSIDETIAAAGAIHDAIDEVDRNSDAKEVQQYVSAIGSSEGLASRLENDPATGPEFGTVMVQLLSPLDRNRHEKIIIEEIRSKIKPLPGVDISINQVEEGPPGGADVAIRLVGKDLDKLGEMSDTLVQYMKQMDGTVDCKSDFRRDNPELVIEPDPDIVGLFGFTESQVATAVQTAIAGDNRIQITLDDEDVTLRLQLAPEYQKYPDDLKRLILTSPTGQKATIGQLADLRRTSGLYSINRYNRNRSVMPRCNVQKPTVPDDIFKQLQDTVLPKLGFLKVKKTDQNKFFAGKEEITNAVFVGQIGTPAEGIRAEFTGENEERDKNFNYLLGSMIIGVMLIFSILVLQFNSFRQSMIVLISVPLSFIGVVLGMWIFGFPFSLASFIGLVSLTGIVVNDAIVMVDFTNQARQRGLAINEALIEAGVNRLRPVLLTTLTTCGGLMPLMLNISGGAEFWQPLTAAVVFGLLAATSLTLIVVPVFYSIAYSAPRWLVRTVEVAFGLLLIGYFSYQVLRIVQPFTG